MSDRRKRQAVRILALVVLVGAILPNVTYIGHWTVRGLEEATQVHLHDGDHAFHCHGDSSCADQAAYGLQWWAEGQGTLILDGGPELAFDTQPTPSASEPFLPRLDPPPQYA